MKKAIITLANDKIKDISAISHPMLKNYASKVKADFVVISDFKINLGSFHWEKFQCYGLLDKYKRILILDSDIIIVPDAPNLFDVVPENRIGVILEDKYSRKKDRRMRIKNCQKQLGDIGWRKDYLNSGVFVCSRMHKKIFTLNPKNYYQGLGYDDVQIGYNIKKYGFKIFELSYKFNHMSMFSEIGKNRFFSYIVHYAGIGFSSKISKAEQMRNDYKKILNNNWSFARHFYDLPNRLKLIIKGIKLYFI